VGEILATGAKSKKVSAEVSRLVAALGPELAILCEAPVAEVSRVGGSLLGEAVARLRRGEVIKDPGYDGEYGSIRLFRERELEAAGALFEMTKEMDSRYERFAKAGVRKIEEFNAKFPDDKLPYVVIIIDELADLMLIAPARVETTICRIAQLARATGIHLIVATQRPSVDVVDDQYGQPTWTADVATQIIALIQNTAPPERASNTPRRNARFGATTSVARKHASGAAR